VAEIDPDVVETAHRFFDFPRDSPVRVRVEDARTFVDSVRGTRRYDVVYGDAFNAFSVPYHLTTREFAGKVRAAMAPDGVYLTNLIDILDSGAFLNAYLNTVRAAFPWTAVWCSDPWATAQRNTFVVAAAARDPGIRELRDGAGNVFARPLSEETLAALRARHGALQLTDDHAPVESLMAPVFLGAVR
jgi:spermidine synthase